MTTVSSVAGRTVSAGEPLTISTYPASGPLKLDVERGANARRLNGVPRWNHPANRPGGLGMYIGGGFLALIIIILLLIWLF
jgi:hypothetical protein